MGIGGRHYLPPMPAKAGPTVQSYNNESDLLLNRIEGARVNVHHTNLNSAAFQDHLTKGLGRMINDPFKKKMPKYRPPVGVSKLPPKATRQGRPASGLKANGLNIL